MDEEMMILMHVKIKGRAEVVKDLDVAKAMA